MHDCISSVGINYVFTGHMFNTESYYTGVRILLDTSSWMSSHSQTRLTDMSTAYANHVSWKFNIIITKCLHSCNITFVTQVADYLDTEHHEIVFTPEQGIEALENVIYHLESYDITTVRASVGMCLCQSYTSVQNKQILASKKEYLE